MRWCIARGLLFGLVFVAAACGGSGSVPDVTPTGQPQAGEASLTELELVNTRADLNFPSQIQFRFALRDQTGAPIVVPQEDIGVRVFERETGTKVWEEIDETETNLLVRSAQSFQIETFFVLDFTNSIAQTELVAGVTGLEAIASVFRLAATALPGAHRIGVVEFHDRNADPAVLSDLTTDRDTLITTVDNLSVLSGSSRLWDAIAGALSLLSVGGEKPGVVKTLVFLSDGRDVSSLKTRDEALKLALDWGIQLYAVGIGNVPEETELAEMVRASGGVYYSAPDPDSLQAQVRQLINDLLGQYMVSYISLREAGSHSVRVEITALGSTAALETDSLDFGSFYGQDIQGVVSFDPVAVDVTGENATVYVRAAHVPRSTTEFRFRHVTRAPIQVSLEPKDSGGLLEGWVVTGPDGQGYYDISSATPLEFGSFGVLMKLTVPLVTGDTTGTLLEFDNTIYQADKRFFYPPHSDDLAARLRSSTIQVYLPAAAVVVVDEEGRYDFLNSFYWWILALNRDRCALGELR